MKTKIHAISGTVGFVCIMMFWTSTAYSELFLSYEAIASVKAAILKGMFLFIPVMAIAGGSGMSLGAKWKSPLAMAKKRRMPFIALNGILILLPSAAFLAHKSSAEEFDVLFYTIQFVELAAGAINLSLMGMNIRDGLQMTRRIHKRN